ncbi:TPA: amidohydrolase family protein [Escherichia coli]|nr:amidohydrolase family protein [Escherichia coli]
MIINNVKLVLENEVVHGSLEVQDGEIRAFAESQSRLPEAMDGEGGWLLPGLIELHTDNLDKFFTPRPKVDWPAHSAMSSHDALMVASGITTVLDAVAIGDVRDGGDRLDILSSDYYPASLLDAAFRVADDESNRFTLPQAVRLVTKIPAQALNLQDRGVIGEGKRADLVLAHRQGNHIHIDHVWRQGKRVF